MTSQVAEQVAAKIPGDTDERKICDPTGQSPEQIRLSAALNPTNSPKAYHTRLCPTALVCKGVDQKFDAVLRAHRRANGCQNRDQDDGVRHPAPEHELKQESDRTIGVSAYITHCRTLCRGNVLWFTASCGPPPKKRFRISKCLSRARVLAGPPTMLPLAHHRQKSSRLREK
jgi:hypothetical protein